MDRDRSNSRNKYERVMPRVYTRSRSSLEPRPLVTRHETSASRLGAKSSVSNDPKIFTKLPTVLNDYEEPVDRIVKGSSVVKPRRTLKSLDPEQSPYKARLTPGRPRASHPRVPISAPSVAAHKAETWSEEHVRKCHSSRSHSQLRELKEEINSYRETEKLLRTRARLFEKHGVVLNDVGEPLIHREVQVETPTEDKESKDDRCRQWLTLIDRQDLLQKQDVKMKSYVVCSEHFEDSSFKLIKRLDKNALPSIFLHNKPQEGSSCSETPQVSSQESKIKVKTNIFKEAPSCSKVQSTSAQTKCTNKLFAVKKNEKYATVATQTDSKLQSIEEQTLTLNSFTAETPRKRRLSNEIRESKMIKRRKLEQEVTKIRKELETKNLLVTCNDLDNEIGRRFQKLVEWRNIIENQYKGNRYETEFKVFALNLYYSSPQTYRCFQTVLKLPSKNILYRLKTTIPPKFENRVLDSLALKFKSLPDAAKYCTICVDEMSLKRNLYYNIKTDEVIGFHNVNGKISPEIASNACVIMLQGICFNWNQPLAYALLATAEHYEEIDVWINDIITKLSTIGLSVKAIVSDQGSNFDKFAKEVKNVTAEKPFFIHDDNKIYYIFDVPHLIKCIRNNLLTSDFIYGGKKISWDYIEQLHKDQKERNLRLIPKVTDAHIQPNNFQKTKVKLAVQLLSRTVSAALHTYIDLGKISEEARPTAEFLELMNDLFDILNSSKIKCSNKFVTAFRLSKDQEKVLNSATQFFAATKAINRKTGKDNTGYIESLVNFQISIESIKMLYEDLKNDGFKYLLTRKLNKDNLEIFFGAIRQQGVSCSEPTPIQFQRAFSKLFICNMLKSSPYTNCGMDICDLLLKAEDFMKVQLLGTNSLPQTSLIHLGGETDYRIDLPDDNALTYVSGYLFFKCVKEHKCPDIIKVLDEVLESGEANLFTKYKAFNKKSSFYGSLKMPPKELIQYVENLETVFIKNFDTLIRNNPGGELLKLFESIPQQTPCDCFPVNYLLKLFARFRIFAAIKFNNRQLKLGKKDIKTYIKVSHL